MGVVTRPIGVGRQASKDEPFNRPGRYYLKLALEDTSSKDVFNDTGGSPISVELAVEVLGRRGGAPSLPKESEEGPTPSGTATPNEPPSVALLGVVGGGLAALGFAVGAAARRRRQ
jgi:hypothetical protein